LQAAATVIGLARTLPPAFRQGLAIPGQLPVYWEMNHRTELALELGFLQDRLLITAAVNRGRTSNQLIRAVANDATHIRGLLSNERGIDIENRALELGVQLDKVRIGRLGMASSLMLTVPRNRIVRWPGLAGSIYAGQYVEGRSVTVTPSYHFKGVNDSTGLYTFQTVQPDGVPDPSERVPDKGLDAAWYAGWSQRLNFGNWELEWLFDYRRQRGTNPLIVLAAWKGAPGVQALQQLSNGPVEWLDHWRKPGDVSGQQRLTADSNSNAMARQIAYEGSDAVSIGASYLRLRTVTLSYRLPAAVAKRLGLKDGRISVSGQNLWTLTHFPVTDPETQDPTVLPPMRIIVAGVHVAF
jgi:hypothetical protein